MLLGKKYDPQQVLEGLHIRIMHHDARLELDCNHDDNPDHPGGWVQGGAGCGEKERSSGDEAG